jgi:putative transposase
MKYDPDQHHRRSLRLPGYDYSQPGAYFELYCVHQRQCLFGEIIDGQMRFNQYGAIVNDEWQISSIIRREIKLDAWVVMPNHFYGIVIIKNIVRKNRDRKVSNIAVVIVCTMNIQYMG